VVVVTIAACSGSGPAASTDPRVVRFVDESASAGIDHVYDGDFEFFVGGGVAAFDCNEDGRPELFFAGGTQPAALYRNRTPVGGPMQFEQVESAVTDLTLVTGAYPLDVDSDGVTDLAVLRRGPNRMLRGLGDCRFEEASERWDIDPGNEWSTAFSATWEESSRLPTLAYGNYLVADTYDCDSSRFVRPSTADEAFGPAAELAPGYCTLSMLFSDWDRSGRRDLRVSNDRHYYTDGSEQLWEVAADAPPTLYSEADGWRPLQVWGMGIASRDVTGDGLPEVFITSQGDNKLQTLDDGASGPAYRDIALRRGVTAQRPYTGGDVLPSTAWHPEFADVDNDGYTDLFVTKGNVEAQSDHAERDPSNLLLGQPDGTFLEAAETAGIVRFDRARGASVVDLDLDGLLDLVVVNRRQPPVVWHNVGAGGPGDVRPLGHWLAVRLRQEAPNVDAVGAWLDVRIGDRVLSREITVGGGHAGGQLGWLHTGLGPAEKAQVRVQWPDGVVGPWTDVDADQFVTIERGAAGPQPWTG
jgi:hypothetical protein